MVLNVRMPHVDALRGLAILFVVFGHVEIFSFFDFQHTTIIGRTFAAIQLPLFFFISGFCSYSTKNNGMPRLLSKFAQLVIPAFTVGLFYTHFYLGVGFDNFFSNASKLGYWFPLSLFEMFCISYFCSLIKEGGVRQNHCDIYLVVVSLFLYCMKLPFKTSPMLDTIGNYTSLHYTLGYFQFFATGILLRKYIHIFDKILKLHTIMTGAICVFFISFVSLIFVPQIVDSASIKGQIWITIVETLIAYPAIYILYVVFYRLLENTRITVWLSYIGRRTMDVYLLHYFLLPTLPMVGDFLINYPNVVVELLVGFILSAIIVLMSVGIGRIIRLSPIVSRYLLGVK